MAELKYKPGKFDLVVKRASAGLGLFVGKTAIPRGACIIEYTGPAITEKEKYKSRSKYLFDLDNGTTIDGQGRDNKARYINHSCKPNCEPNIHRNRVFIHATRNIKPGEELGYDYGLAYFDAYIGENCRCAGCAPKPVATAAEMPAVKAVAKAAPVKAAATKAVKARKTAGRAKTLQAAE